MGLLAPLYALAALAIVGPIVFHLIRRQPKQKTQFSSLIFLSPSPPRLTRRSRLDNILLLLLRGLAIALIALAFARPYLRQESFLNSTLDGRNLVVLLDTSASMQREDIWNASIAELNNILDSASPEDRVSLYTISDELSPVVPFGSEAVATASASVDSVRSSVGQLKPTWRKTELAKGLRTVADMLSAATIAGSVDQAGQTKIILISDLHAESGLDSLQGFPWPATIQLDVRQSLPAIPGNARLSLMLSDDAEEQGDDAEAIKVRIENNQDSLPQIFEVAWFGSDGLIPNTSMSIQVPAGQVRVVPVAKRPSRALYLQLLGDGWDGDNRVFVPEVKPVQQEIAFVGIDVEREEESLMYFLEKAPLSTPLVQRTVVATPVDRLDLSKPDLSAVILEPVPGCEPLADGLRDFAESGGTVIVSLARAPTEAIDTVGFLKALCQDETLELSEARVKDYTLVSGIDYQHPVFAPFADPRFNDFSKLRFWKHRHLAIPESDSKFRVIASFDDRTPWLVESRVGLGRVWIMTTGWQPEASSLALSSKFLPIMLGLLDPDTRQGSLAATYEVGQLIDISNLIDSRPDGENAGTDVAAADLSVTDQDGIPATDDQFAIEAAGIRLFEPGLYNLQSASGMRQVAAQVPASESQHLPLDPDVFDQYGVATGKVAGDAERREALRQLQIEELEGKQRLWQWLIVAGLVVLALETGLAGWLARRGTKQLSAA